MNLQGDDGRYLHVDLSGLGLTLGDMVTEVFIIQSMESCYLVFNRQSGRYYRVLYGTSLPSYGVGATGSSSSRLAGDQYDSKYDCGKYSPRDDCWSTFEDRLHCFFVSSLLIIDEASRFFDVSDKGILMRTLSVEEGTFLEA